MTKLEDLECPVCFKRLGDHSNTKLKNCLMVTQLVRTCLPSRPINLKDVQIGDIKSE